MTPGAPIFPSPSPRKMDSVLSKRSRPLRRIQAIEIKQVLESAIANASANHSLDPSNLFISKAIADEGPIPKRFRPRARGRAGRINKRTSHILIELESKTE